jgi:hypothetical protein
MMRDTVIYFESTSKLFIVHFDKDGQRCYTHRFWADDATEMVNMSKEVMAWHTLD